MKKKSKRYGIINTLVILLILIAVPVSHAQYFGRNKVQYEKFDFSILQTEHFNVYYYPVEREAVTDAARMAERWYNRYTTLFNHALKEHQPLVLYSNHPDFQQTNIIGGLISQGVGGVTEGAMDRIVIPLTGNYAENDHVIGHELVHAYQYEIIHANSGGAFSGRQLPLWMIEGMAEYLSLGRYSNLTAMWMRDAVLNDDLPTVSDLAGSTYFPYRYGHALWAYIAGKWGEETVPHLFKASVHINYDEAIKKTLKISRDSLSKEWQAALKNTYGPQIEGKTKPEDVGHLVVGDPDEPGINLAPEISPNGKYIALISRQDLFTLDLFLTDAATGKIIRKLSSSSSDNHFDAISFTNSAGAWSPDSKRFAYVVVKDGDNAIAVVDVASGDTERIIKFKEIGAIYHLAWSPDGKTLAFSGTSGGISDLFTYDLNDNKLTRLTNDRYADLQPSWSPDGTTIAFATDRGPQTDFDILSYGKLRLGLMDVQSGRISLIQMDDSVKHINPQYSSDGNYLYFISDPDGFSDIYRYSFSDNSIEQITDIATGISGLTENSPALSVSRDGNLAAFSVFDKSGFNVYTLDLNRPNGTAYAKNPDISATLPPVVGSEQYVDRYLAQPREGLVGTSGFRTKPYDADLHLIQAGVSAGAVSVDRYGTSLGGGASLIFSDILGNHLLETALQVNGGIRDLGGQLLYLNRSHRLNWGVLAGHIPYRSAGLAAGYDTVDVNGQPTYTYVEDFIKQRTFIDELSGILEYPLSQNRRIELSSGFSRYSYDTEADRTVYLNGYPADTRTRSLPSPSALNLWQSTLAYVGDYSYTGFTSPVKGSRYRFDVEPTFGSLSYLTVLADYRHYFFVRPFTFAFRALHYGRYFKDSESDRLSALYVGQETLVRGYDINSFSGSECTSGDTSGSCPEIDRLIGSRIGVMNFEIRVPLFGTSEYGLVDFSYLPTELSLFLDGGVAWRNNSHVDLKFQERSSKRIPVFSAGAAARVNLLGYVVLQFYYAFPFQRPDKTGQFGFVIAPGW